MRRNLVLGLIAVALIALHFWRSPRPILYFGWLPEELAYRLLFVLIAWLFIMFVTKRPV